MKEAEMNGDKAHFSTDNQTVSLHPQGQDSWAAVPTAPKTPRFVQATLALSVVTIVISLTALCVAVLQNRRPAWETQPYFQEFLGNDTPGQSVEPDNSYHFDRAAELRETIQMFKDHVENSSTWNVEIQMLMCSMNNVSSQIQMLSSHLKNASADIQMVKGVLKDVSTLSSQTQILKSSLEGASAEIQRQKGDLEKANALNSQTQSFLKTSLKNTSFELQMLSGGLESTNTEIQALKAGLEMANAQAQLANSSLKNANNQILVLRGNLDSVNDLRAQNQGLRNSLEGTNSEIQKLKGSLQNANDLNSQTQTLVKGSLDNTSAEIQSLRSHLERAGNDIHLLKRDVETATGQIQKANGRLEQMNAQIQGLKIQLEKTNALNSNIQVLHDHLRNASGDIRMLKGEMKDAAALKSKTQILENNLQEVKAEIQRLKGDLRNTETLSAKVQEQHRSLEALRAAFDSKEQQWRSLKKLLQLILQDWKIYGRNLYYFSREKKFWQDAEQSCVSQGAHLASVTSAEEQAYLVEFTRNTYYWIGLNDRNKEGHWQWTDGTSFNFQFWFENQPDNWNNEDCIQIQQKWNDIKCNTLHQWICKKPISQVWPELVPS
ncbi:C-type lectin domain family 4 member F isoform 2-T2 [Rhynchonycteris naso]